MLKLKHRTKEIEELSKDNLLIADIDKPIKLFQGQSVRIKTGTAIETDQHAFAVPTKGNNELGLCLGSGMELLSDGVIEVTLWNRNHQGTPRMIEIKPNDVVAELVVMAKYFGAEKLGKAPAKTVKQKVSK